MSKWIDVKKRLPKLKPYREDGVKITPITKNVIIYDAVENAVIDSSYSKARGFDGNKDVTHWMNYPKPPKL